MYKFTAILTFLILQQLNMNAQYLLKEADLQYELYNFNKAIDLYKEAWKKKKKLHTAERLAICYQLQNNYSMAENWASVAASYPNSNIENTLIYAKALQSNEKFKDAKVQFSKYAAINKNSNAEQVKNWLLSCDSAVHWLGAPNAVTVKNFGELNSIASDWGAVIQYDSIVFVSNRRFDANALRRRQSSLLKFDKRKAPDKIVDEWTGNAYLKLYSKRGLDSTHLLHIIPETDYHIGTATFNSNGKEFFFSSTYVPSKPAYITNRDLKAKVATVHSNIYVCQRDSSGTWGSPAAVLKPAASDYSNIDPFISGDGQRLYFSSNLPGGKGGMDIYVIRRQNNQSWSEPENLTDINTAGNERSPFMTDNQVLYFSSDGLIGIGGLDVYSSRLINSIFQKPENLGSPVNSAQDDFSYFINTDSSIFFSSNRPGGLGDDDIYRILPIAKKENLRIDTTTSLATYYTNSNLKNGIPEKRKADGTPVPQFGPIYYDFEKVAIRADALEVLNRLIDFMNSNQAALVKIQSHTDSRGTAIYNQWLSERRAGVVAKYIIARGIDKKRITSKGYGETSLLNGCTDHKKCSAHQHQLNRRTEFEVFIL